MPKRSRAETDEELDSFRIDGERLAAVEVDFSPIPDLPSESILPEQVREFCKKRRGMDPEFEHHFAEIPDFEGAKLYCGDITVKMFSGSTKKVHKFLALVPVTHDNKFHTNAFKFLENTEEQVDILKRKTAEESTEKQVEKPKGRSGKESMENDDDPDSHLEPLHCDRICVSFTPDYQKTAMLSQAMHHVSNPPPGDDSSIFEILIAIHRACFEQVTKSSKQAMNRAFQYCHRKWNVIMVFLYATLVRKPIAWEGLAIHMKKQPADFIFKKTKKAAGMLTPSVKDSTRLGFISACVKLVEKCKNENKIGKKLKKFDFAGLLDSYPDWIGVITQPFVGSMVQTLDPFFVWYALQLFMAQALKICDLEGIHDTFDVFKDRITKYLKDTGTPPTMFNAEVKRKGKGRLCYFLNGRTTTTKSFELKMLPRDTLLFVVIGETYYGVVVHADRVYLSPNPLLKTPYRWPAITRHAGAEFDSWVEEVKSAFDGEHCVQSFIVSLLNYCPELLYHYMSMRTIEEADQIWKDLMEQTFEPLLQKGIIKESIGWVSKLTVQNAKILAIHLLDEKVFKMYHLFACSIPSNEEIFFMISPMATSMNFVTYSPLGPRTTNHSGYIQKPLWEEKEDEEIEG